MKGLIGKRVKVYYNVHKKCLSVMDAKTRRVIAHVPDICLDDVEFKTSEKGMPPKEPFSDTLRDGSGRSIHYLKDSSIDLLGLKIYGTPWTPYFCDWAFNGLEDRGTEGQGYEGGPGWSAQPDADHPHLSGIYAKIPDDTDILVCHGPPRLGTLDLTLDGKEVGSWELRKRIEQLSEHKKLKLVCTGHIHEGYGCHILNGVQIINAASCDRSYKIANQPVIVEL